MREYLEDAGLQDYSGVASLKRSPGLKKVQKKQNLGFFQVPRQDRV